MTNEIAMTVEGLDELIAVTNPKLLNEPLQRFFKKSAIAVTNKAKPLTPADQGRLRGSMTYVVDSAAPPLWARIGTNVKYAKPIEFGTGLLSDAPDSKGRRYFPPPAALDRWAKLHGIAGGGFVVALAIWKRGGTKKHRMLRDGFDQSLNTINNYLGDAAREIGIKWKI